MKTLLTLLTCLFIFSPNVVLSESYVCAFKYYGIPEEICQSTYRRTPNGFEDDFPSIHKFITKENERFILLMAGNFAKNVSAGIKSIIIDKKSLSFIKDSTSFDDPV